jgi:hypothetical protein
VQEGWNAVVRKLQTNQLIEQGKESKLKRITSKLTPKNQVDYSQITKQMRNETIRKYILIRKMAIETKRHTLVMQDKSRRPIDNVKGRIKKLTKEISELCVKFDLNEKSYKL